MRKLIHLAGIVMVLQGVSGTIDRLFVQPFFGPVLNFFNRVVVGRLDFLTGYEIFANLSLAALGVSLVIAADRTRPS
ncbi:hypothetical protein [Planomonospora venezuelensis]|uniref:Uncharacterized protein n=1 Tax=Planomonospora venezuelensis TaxID=1999 RepID=A0A841DDS9_PLAVE|nr:hypothetical protein [Planomonospora venezuelensis]MBB5967027.1 hypothetical protein [Planomonospora venezuelensis]GIN01503.1 hypothetical protein Pve01_31610 [Planomonospora venezuelensis]